MAIRARDMEATAKFYREVLGLKEAFRMHNTPDGSLGSIHMFVAPSQYIEIFPHGEKECKHDKTTIGHCHMCYEVEDAEAALKFMKERGAPIDSDIKLGFSKCIQFFTHDPDGNSIEIMQLPPDCLQVEANNRFAGEQSK
jgi:lactoylglutathione lyase